jgi:hypothetical protein
MSSLEKRGNIILRLPTSFLFYYYIIMEKLSIEERLDLLQEAENFFADLSSA